MRAPGEQAAADPQTCAVALHLEAREDDDRREERQHVARRRARAATASASRAASRGARAGPRRRAATSTTLSQQREDAGDGGHRDADLRSGQRGQQQPAACRAARARRASAGAGWPSASAQARGLLVRDRRRARSRRRPPRPATCTRSSTTPNSRCSEAGRGVDGLHAGARDDLLVGREDARAVVQRDVVEPVRRPAPARVADRRARRRCRRAPARRRCPALLPRTIATSTRPATSCIAERSASTPIAARCRRRGGSEIIGRAQPREDPVAHLVGLLPAQAGDRRDARGGVHAQRGRDRRRPSSRCAARRRAGCA